MSSTDHGLPDDYDPEDYVGYGQPPLIIEESEEEKEPPHQW